MKKAAGILAFVLVLVFIVLVVLAIWGVRPISWLVLSKTVLTIIISCIGIVVLYVIGYLFFKNEKKDYDTAKGNKAHPIK